MPAARTILSSVSILVIAVLGAWPVSGFAEEEKKKADKPKYNAYKEFTKANRLVSYGGYSRAIKHYERALKVEPDQYTIAHFNLGEIYRAKSDCAKAVLHYQIYVLNGRDDEALQFSKEGIAECTKRDAWGRISVDASATPGATIKLDEWILSRDPTVEEAIVPPGAYKITVEAKDHLPDSKTVKIEPESEIEETFDLEKRVFYGEMKVTIDQKGATFKVIPKKLDKPSLEQKALTHTAPMEEPIKLPTGKYLLEVTHEGYDRWIRHIYITRDNESLVNVTMYKSLPPEIRAQQEDE